MSGLLFIDDEEGIRRSISRALKREPYPVYVTENGEKGIQFFEKNLTKISTVISDYKMPGIDGLETLTTIGLMNPEITRIILTGYATMEAAIMATNEGLDGFLTKPFENMELREKIREISIRKRLKRFVSEQVYQEIENSPIALEPTYHEASILFADIRGFTRMSQNVSPEALANFLTDDYFVPMGEVIYNFNGTVDKHIGDSIMVVFGSPVANDDDAIRSVKTAMAMQKKASEINRNLIGKNGLTLQIGTGIATGYVFSGIVGSLRKKEYTSIGMPVNIASRLQGIASGGETLMCERTYQKVKGEIEAETLPPVRVKGIDEPINVFKINV